MCFTRRKSKEKRATKKYKNKIVPYVVYENRDEITTEKFLKECLICFNCKKYFNLKSSEIKINCAGCGEFFHCGISGTCNCTEETVDGKTHNQRWCVNCVPPVVGNEEKVSGEGSCVCYNCLN